MFKLKPILMITKYFDTQRSMYRFSLQVVRVVGRTQNKLIQKRLCTVSGQMLFTFWLKMMIGNDERNSKKIYSEGNFGNSP